MFKEPPLPVSIPPLESAEEEYEVRFQELLKDYIKATKLPLDTVALPEFRNLVYHLNPDVKIPSFSTLFKPSSTANRNTVLNMMLKSKIINSVPPLELEKFPSEVEMNDVMNGTATSKENPYICIVCLKPRNVTEVKKFVERDMLFFLLVCFAKGVFPMEVAQKLFTMPNARCCGGHLKSLVSSAMNIMEISHRDQIVLCSEQTMAVPFSIMNRIKNPNLPDIELTVAAASGFRTRLNTFFKKYAASEPHRAFTIPNENDSGPSAEKRIKEEIKEEDIFPEDFPEPY